MRQFGAIALVAATLGCGAPGPQFESATDAILGGAPDGAHPGVVVVRNPRGTCTGTVLSPHLVLTARHCVADEPGASVPCPANDPSAPRVPSYSGDVAPGSVSISLTRTSAPVATAVAFFDDGAASGCGHDLAVVQVDAALALPASAFRATVPADGDSVTVVGWGVVDDARTPAAERYAKEAAIVAVGPASFRYSPYGDPMQGTNTEPVVDGELLLTAGTTGLGDCGGPAFDAPGAIVGTDARGFAHPAYGPTHLSSTAAHADVLAAAFRAAGETPAAVPAAPTSGGGGTATGGTAAGGCASTAGAGWLALAMLLARRRSLQC